MKAPAYTLVDMSNLQNAPKGPDGTLNWLEALVTPFNTAVAGTRLALTGNLTGPEQGLFDHVTTTFTTPSDYASGGFSCVIPWALAQKRAPNSVVLANIAPPSGVLTTAVTLNGWTYSSQSGQVSITYITGLAADTTYTATFEVK